MNPPKTTTKKEKMPWQDKFCMDCLNKALATRDAEELEFLESITDFESVGFEISRGILNKIKNRIATLKAR